MNPAAADREELTDVHVTEEGVGTFYVWAMKPFGRVRFEPFVVRTEFVPNKRIVDRWSLPFYGYYTYTVDAEGSGTRLTLQRRPRPFWRLRLLDMLVDQFEGRSNEQFLRRLKAFLEVSGGSAQVAG